MSEEEDAIADRLEAAAAELESAEERVEEIGEGRLRDLEDAHDQLRTLFGRYEERATGSGDFGAFIEFQERLAELVEDLPNDLPEREVFEDIDERMQKRRLTQSDFEEARDSLEPVADLLQRLEDRSAAKRQYRSVRHEVEDRIHELRDEIDRLEQVASLADVDLDAPTSELRERVEAYNESVRSAFQSFRSSASARAVIQLVQTAEQYPLIPFDDPPSDLASYLTEADVGNESLPTLLEYAEYSRSKLAHYVEEPATFQRVVGGNMTYLDRLDAEPLTIEWPPPSADELRWRGRELTSMLNRFAPSDPIEDLDRLLELARDESRYRELRLAARAGAELSEAERELVADGTVADRLAELRERRQELQDALDRY
ncbi:MAG: hypothetical protein ABEJ27_06100 [Halodesulfurarchaeum sp.]